MNTQTFSAKREMTILRKRERLGDACESAEHALDDFSKHVVIHKVERIVLKELYAIEDKVAYVIKVQYY